MSMQNGIVCFSNTADIFGDIVCFILYKNRNNLSEETLIPLQYLSLVATLNQRFEVIYRRKYN
jgi:hypothetical protein